jgi:hypothetical protein
VEFQKLCSLYRTQCHFDIEPFLGVTARAVFSAGSFASVARGRRGVRKVSSKPTINLAADGPVTNDLPAMPPSASYTSSAYNAAER